MVLTLFLEIFNTTPFIPPNGSAQIEFRVVDEQGQPASLSNLTCFRIKMKAGEGSSLKFQTTGLSYDNVDGCRRFATGEFSTFYLSKIFSWEMSDEWPHYAVLVIPPAQEAAWTVIIHDTGSERGSTLSFEVTEDAYIGSGSEGNTIHFNENNLPSITLTVDDPPPASPDINKDGRVDASDALILYYSYSFISNVGTGR